MFTLPPKPKIVPVPDFEIGAAIGVMTDRSINRTFEPLTTFAGRFNVVGLRMPVGAVAASQVIQGGVSLQYYFE